MTDRIIPLPGARHHRARLLLPWYVTDALDEGERAEVEAHLGACAECRGELAFERGLHAEFAATPVALEQGWARLRDQVTRQPREARGLGRAVARLTAVARGVGGDWLTLAPWLRWTLAGQFAVILAIGGLAFTRGEPAHYHALGRAPVSRTGNLVVVFRPETSERLLRETLEASQARVVDGPTSTDAYLLSVRPAGRDAALARLRGAAAVELAEPVDAGAAP